MICPSSSVAGSGWVRFAWMAAGGLGFEFLWVIPIEG